MKERPTGRAQGLSLASSAPSWFSKPSTLAKPDTAVTNISTLFFLEPFQNFQPNCHGSRCLLSARLHVSPEEAPAHQPPPAFFLCTHTLSSLGSFTPGAQPLPTGRQFSDLSLQLTQPPLPGALQARGLETHVQQPSPPSHESPGKSQPS